MSQNTTIYLPENNLLMKIEKLNEQFQQLRTAQLSTSDVEAPMNASVVEAFVGFGFTDSWEDMNNPGGGNVAATVTVDADSIINVLLTANVASSAANSLLACTIAVDGTNETDEANANLGEAAPSINGISIKQNYSVMVSAGTHTIQGRLKKYSGYGALSYASIAYWIFRQ